MALYYLAGEYYNLLSRGTVTVSPGTDALTTESALYDARSASPWKASANSANPYVNIDVNIVDNSGFEASSSGWTSSYVDTGAGASTSVGEYSGDWCLRLTGGSSGTAEWYRDINVRTGERIKLSAYISVSGTSDGSGSIRIRDLGTGLYWGGSSWGSAAANAAISTNTTAYTNVSTSFRTAQSTALGGWFTSQLRLTCHTCSTGNILFDDVELLPAVNWCSVHGHNLREVMNPALLSSTDGWVTTTTQATFTVRRPSFYTRLSSPVFANDWRVYLAGTNTTTPWLGEIVLGYAESIAQPQRYQWLTTMDPRMVTLETQAGELWRLRTADDIPRAMRLSFRQGETAAYEELRDQIWRRPYGGELTLVVAPYHGDPEVVLGHIMTPLEINRMSLYLYENELLIREQGFPVVGL